MPSLIDFLVGNKPPPRQRLASNLMRRQFVTTPQMPTLPGQSWVSKMVEGLSGATSGYLNAMQNLPSDFFEKRIPLDPGADDVARDWGPTGEFAGQLPPKGYAASPLNGLIYAVDAGTPVGDFGGMPEGMETESDRIGDLDALSQVFSFTDVTGGAVGATNAIGRLLNKQKFDPNTVNANVWQGSPAKYGPGGASDSLKHMSSGEGAQAYGWGRYDAQNEAVGRDYFNQFNDPENMPLHFKDKPVDVIWNDGIVERWPELTEGMNADQIDDFTVVMGNLSQVNNFDDIGYVLENFNPAQKRMYRELVEPSLTKPTASASLYKHDLPDEDIAKYLDWDAPLSEQPESVRAGLRRLPERYRRDLVIDKSFATPEWAAYERAIRAAAKTDSDADKALQIAREMVEGNRPRTGDYSWQHWKSLDKYAPDVDHNAIHDVADMSVLTGGDFVQTLGAQIGGQQVSEALDAAGIPGLKYFDEGSRRAGQGTRNFVTWNQGVLDRMKMLQRNDEVFDSLPMDEASRMARGREQGFGMDSPLFHQTTVPSETAIRKSGFDTSIVRNRWTDEVMPDGVFLKPSSAELPLINPNQKQVQMELVTRAKNIKEFANREDLSDFLYQTPKWAKLSDEIDGFMDFAPEVMEGVVSDKTGQRGIMVLTEIGGMLPAEAKALLKKHKKNPYIIGAEVEKLFENMRGGMAASMREEATKILKKKKYDGIRVLEDWGGDVGNEVVTESTVIFDSAKIRNPKAKFDPKKSRSKNLMAGVATMLGGGVLAASLMKPQEQY